ncbi:metallophosphoesterase [Legionella rowbothamii]|uniref:metallophosphoesterase n=1 Tax=Legionella rowbothamii TaxID=96229 RepID=UPI001056E0E7|nr:metallophosphoesterase [Legionella rowbothamii]
MSFVIRSVLLTFFLLSFTYAAPIQFLTVSDIHYGAKNSLGDGQDAGPELLKLTENKIKELSPTVNFILFLGDIPAHALLFTAAKAEYEKTVFQSLYRSDVAQKPIFYIPGNNDSLQGNYQPFEKNGISPLTYATDWDGACAHCKGLIIDDSHMYHDGYYSSYVIPNNKEVILFALNATQWTKISWLRHGFLSKYKNQDADAQTQLGWLEEQLKSHSAKQLLIAMHEPPGRSYLGEPIWYEQYEQDFIKILNKYSNLYGQITLLSSHTHMEEFRRIRLDNGMNLYDYATPSISRNHHNYSALKIFSLTPELRIKDFTTYYTSSLHEWKNEQYHALGTLDPILPNCQNQTLAECLDQLSPDQVCEDLDKGAFYGVKNPNVSDNNCKKIFTVN